MAVAFEPQPQLVALSIYNGSGETVALVASPTMTAADFFPVTYDGTPVTAASDTVTTVEVASTSLLRDSEWCSRSYYGWNDLAGAIEISLQPKQWTILEWLGSKWSGWIGVGGGRGAAKSGGADRVLLTLAHEEKAIVSCVVMRNYDQVRKYHIEPTMRAWPHLAKSFRVTDSKLTIPSSRSEIDYSYAENLADVERRFRSANYKYIIVDQAEQFTEQELREMKNACRWPGGGAKMLLLFNMGGVGIQTLRKWFHSHEYNEMEDPADFKFLHVYPWDNVEWSRDALVADGLTEDDYYGWKNEERFEYFITRSDYGKSLNSLDPTLRNRDLLGSWESLEGAYFGRVFDRQATMVDATQVSKILKPWSTRWMSQDWGKSHYCATFWHGVQILSPQEVLETLGWVIDQPLRCVVTYRRKIVSELDSSQVGAEIREATPQSERRLIKQYFLSPDAFGERDSFQHNCDESGPRTNALRAA